jgi:hypothetical protein
MCIPNHLLAAKGGDTHADTQGFMKYGSGMGWGAMKSYIPSFIKDSFRNSKAEGEGECKDTCTGCRSHKLTCTFSRYEK